jgi:hypothetical protein
VFDRHNAEAEAQGHPYKGCRAGRQVQQVRVQVACIGNFPAFTESPEKAHGFLPWATSSFRFRVTRGFKPSRCQRRAKPRAWISG